MQKFLKRLKKKSGLISVLPEFSRDEELVHHDLSDLSRACRYALATRDAEMNSQANLCSTRANLWSMHFGGLLPQGNGRRRSDGASGH